MATRWDLIKATLKREPVSTAGIVSDIRAGTQRVLQPVVDAGARYRVEHPVAAQRISTVADTTTRAIRAPVERQKQISATENQITQSNRNIIALGVQLQNAPIRDNVFVGTDSQYINYTNTVDLYNKNVANVNNAGAKLQILQSRTAQGRGEEAAKGVQLSKTSMFIYNKARKVADEIRRTTPLVQEKIGVFGKPHAIMGESAARAVEFGGMVVGGVETLWKRPETRAPALAVAGYASTIGFAKEFKENPVQTLADMATMAVLFHGAGKVVGKVTPTRVQVKATVAELKPTVKPYTKTTTIKSRKLTREIKKVDTKIKDLEIKSKGKSATRVNIIENRKAKLIDKRTDLINKKNVEVAKILRAESKLRKALELDKKKSQKPEPVSKQTSAKAKEIRAESRKRTDKINKIDNKIESLLDSKKNKTVSQKRSIDNKVQKLIDKRTALKFNIKKIGSKQIGKKADKIAKAARKASKKRTAQIEKIDKHIDRLLKSKIGKTESQIRTIDIKIKTLVDKRTSIKLGVKYVSPKASTNKADVIAKKSRAASRKRTDKINVIDKQIESLELSKTGKTISQKRSIDGKIQKLIDERKSVKLGVKQVSSKISYKKSDIRAKKARAAGRKRTDKISNIDKQIGVLEASKVGKNVSQIRAIDKSITNLVSKRTAIKLNTKRISSVQKTRTAFETQLTKLTQKRESLIKKITNRRTRGKLSKNEIAKIHSEIKQMNVRIKRMREQSLNIRRTTRAKLTDFEIKQQALEAESVGKNTLTEKSMNDMLKLFEEPAKSKPYREIGKEFRAESKKTSEAVKRGELTETRMKDGTVAVQKMEIKPVANQAQTTKVATESKAVQKQELAVETQRVKAMIKPKVAVKIGIKPAQKYRTAVLTQQSVLSVSQVMQQFKPIVAFKSATKVKQKDRTKLLVAPKSKASTLFKPATKYKPAQRVAQVPAQIPKQTVKATPVIRTPKIPKLPPVVPKIKTKTKPKKQPGKQIIIYTATDINNHVASLKSLFG